jgi:ABC-type nitrate/sulfonate/bicarbonate transport system substrate-binding protein
MIKGVVRLFVIISALVVSSGSFAQTKFLLGYSAFSSNITPLWVAKDEGFFKCFDLDPELILIEGSTRGAQALISGDILVMGMTGQPVMSTRARGAEMVIHHSILKKLDESGFIDQLSKR